jgi:hypothetical protein
MARSYYMRAKASDTAAVYNWHYPAPDFAAVGYAGAGGTGTAQNVFVESWLDDSTPAVFAQYYDVKGTYGAVGDGVTNDQVAIQNANDAAAATGGIVFFPKGVYLAPTLVQSSNVRWEGAGKESVTILNTHLTATGSVAAEIAFTAPAVKGATVISIPATGLTGAYLRLSSCINCQSPNAGIEQLGDRITDNSFFAEYVQVKTGAAATATLYRGVEFPYSNTPGGDSAGKTTSVARVTTFHAGGRIKGITFKGRNGSNTEIVKLKWCRDFVFEDCAFDTNDASCFAVAGEYCLDCRIVGGSAIGKRTSITTQTENIIVWISSQNCRSVGVDSFGGYQAFDVTYSVQDATYRGGPALDCGALSCTAEGYLVEGFCSHGGCRRTYFEDCKLRGGSATANGIRIRSRGDRVSRCTGTGRGSSAAGVLATEAALFECDVSYNNMSGFGDGVSFDYANVNFSALRALLGGSSATIAFNKLSNLTLNGISLLASPALATMCGPHVHHNDIFTPGGDGIDVGAYVNGTVLEENRVNGVVSNARGVRFTQNIKRLHIGTHYVYGVDNSGTPGFAIGGASTVNMITDAVTFPGGNADAELYIAQRQFTDATTPFTGIVRVSAAWSTPKTSGWVPQAAGVGATAPTLEMSSLAWYLSGTEVLGQSLDVSGGTQRTYILVMSRAGVPTGFIAAPVGSLAIDTTTGILWAKTSGTGNTGWVKVSLT